MNIEKLVGSRVTLYAFSGLLAFCMLVLAAPPAFAFEGDDAETYSRAKRIALQNCDDCPARTKEGIESAMALLESLLDRPNDDIEPYLMLADIYRTLIIEFYSGEGLSSERENLVKKENAVLGRASKLEPENVSILLRTAETVEGEERIELLRKIVSLDDSRSEAHIWLALELDDPDEAIESGLNAYRVAMPHQKKYIGEHVRYLYIKNSDRRGYIDFQIINRNDINAGENLGVLISRHIQITLELFEQNSKFDKDMEFEIVFTNIGKKPYKLFNHQVVSSSYFWFTIYPDFPDRATIRPADFNEKLFETGNDSSILELQPQEQFRLKTSLSEIIPPSISIPDGGYIISLFYRGDFVRSASRISGPLYSNALFFEISGFGRGNTESTNG